MVRQGRDTRSQGISSLDRQGLSARPAIIQEEAPGDDSDRVPEDETNAKTLPLKPPQISAVSANRQTLKKRRNQPGASKRAVKAVAVTLRAAKPRLQSAKELGKAKQQEQDEQAKALRKKTQAHKLQKSLSPQKAVAGAEASRVPRLQASDKKQPLNRIIPEDASKRARN